MQKATIGCGSRIGGAGCATASMAVLMALLLALKSRGCAKRLRACDLAYSCRGAGWVWSWRLNATRGFWCRRGGSLGQLPGSKVAGQSERPGLVLSYSDSLRSPPNNLGPFSSLERSGMVMSLRSPTSKVRGRSSSLKPASITNRNSR